MNPLQFKLETKDDLGPFRDCLLDNEMDEGAEAVAWLIEYKKRPSKWRNVYLWHDSDTASHGPSYLRRVFSHKAEFEDHPWVTIAMPTFRAAIWTFIMAWPGRDKSMTHEEGIAEAKRAWREYLARPLIQDD